MLYKIQIGILLIVFTVFASCKGELKMVLTDTVSNKINHLAQQYKHIIVVGIDATECTGCAIQNISQWTGKQVQTLKKYNVGLLFFVYHASDHTVKELFETLKDFNCVFDAIGKFKSANSKVFNSVKDNIFVIDRDKNVIFTESPIKDEKTWKRFIKRVKK
ncbi:MAG: hypothetical protein LBD59_01145 [Prevotellaceae bacterium]|jgi:hypothetical protein|nr:hypothetical protein [Prevotellaceae bacterium]